MSDRICEAVKANGHMCGGKATITGFCRPHSRQDGGGRKKKSEIDQAVKNPDAWMIDDMLNQISGMLAKVQQYYKLAASKKNIVPGYVGTHKTLSDCCDMIKKQHDTLAEQVKKEYGKIAEKLAQKEELKGE